MAEERKSAGARGNIVKASRAGEKKGGGGKSAEANIEELIRGVEDQASNLLQNMGNWVNQGDELMGKARSWLKEHPVATAFALQYAKKVNFIPGSIEEAREKAREAGESIRKSAKDGMAAVREHPMDALLIGAGLGLAAAVAFKNR